MVQNLLNLTGVKGAGSHSEWFANARVRVLHNPTHLCVDRLHNVNLLLHNIFNLKSPLFKLSITHIFLNIRVDKSQELCILYSNTHKFNPGESMEKWITEELDRTELGDKRRTKRLMKIVSFLK